MVFSNFPNFFTIFLEVSIMRRVGTERNYNFRSEERRVGTEWNGNFYFLSLSALSNLFWLEMMPSWYLLTF